MSVILDAVNFIYSKAAELAEARRIKVVDFGNDDPRFVMYEHNGQLQQWQCPIPLRKHCVFTVADLCLAANKWTSAKPAPSVENPKRGPGVVWISSKEVVLVLDDENRHEYVRLPLDYTERFSAVCKLEPAPVMDQATLIRLLRREFVSSPQATTILAAVRKLRFSKHEGGFSTIQHGNESLGRTIETEVAGAEAIPDYMGLQTQIFANEGEQENTVGIGFDLEVDVQAQKFRLKPLPDAIRAATEFALNDIRQRIIAGVSKEVAVLRGMAC
ncbi:MAG: hypothetical protein IT422_00675 [Pirellulaceae bacterium]|nr:hypothetical protein [Pirellulaceae bacterium]